MKKNINLILILKQQPTPNREVINSTLRVLLLFTDFFQTVYKIRTIFNYLSSVFSPIFSIYILSIEYFKRKKIFDTETSRSEI